MEIVTNPISDGLWEFDGLANGTYYVLVENGVGLIDQLYSAVPCPAGACNIAAVGTQIVISGHRPSANVKLVLDTAAIDLRLNTGQTISGHVKDAGTNAPLSNATVYLFNSSGAVVGDGTTDGLGDFISNGGLAAGTYYAATANGSNRGVGGNYINGLYSGGNCLLACNVASGTPIVINASPITGVNFSLTQGVGFGGKVVDTGNNALALVTVKIYDSAGKLAGSFNTDSLGRFSSDGLPAGTYYARTFNTLGLQDTLYGGSPCSGNCNVLAGTAITISSGNQPQNINFTLAVSVTLFGDGFE